MTPKNTLLLDAHDVLGLRRGVDLDARFIAKMRDRGTPITETDEPLVARVDHGRWLADCPGCGAGIALTPGAASVGCLGLGCGHRFTNIIWPADEERDEIERTLRARPRIETRNFFPAVDAALERGNPHWRGQTLEDLRDENRAHRLPERHETGAERAERERRGRGMKD